MVTFAMISSLCAASETLTVIKSVNPENIFLYQDGCNPEYTTVTISATGYGGPTSESIPVDVVFAIDSSGSMGPGTWGIGNDPSNLRLTASKSFLDKLDSASDSAGLVAWDFTINDAFGLTHDFPLLKTHIDGVDAVGGTDLDVGLNGAITMLDANPRVGESTEIIIFLTDGDGNYDHNRAVEAQVKGYVVYTILLETSGGGVTNPANLQDMATTTGGKFYSAPTAENLQEIFDEIYQQAIENTAPYNVLVHEVVQDHIIVDDISFSIAPDSVTKNLDGTTTIIWDNIEEHAGNNDNRLEETETFTVTFKIGSSLVGDNVGIEVPGNTGTNPFVGSFYVWYDPTGGFSGSIPQAFIDVDKCSKAVAIDIKPGSCPNAFNRNENGVLPVAIVGTTEFDVKTIDPKSITINGVKALKWEYKDTATPYLGTTSCGCHALSGDGKMDLILHFTAKTVASTLPGTTKINDMVSLNLAGKLKTGSPIEGKDCIKIVK